MLNLGKMLFPKLPPDILRRRLSVVYLTLLVSVAVAVAMVLVMTKTGRLGGH
jgi:hypothetical protein